MKNYVLGFGLCTTWLWLLFLQGPLLEKAAQNWDLSCMLLFFLFLLSHSLTSFAISSHSRLRKALFALKPFSLIIFLLPLLSLCILEGPEGMPFLRAGTPWLPAFISMLAGISAAPLFISWMEKFSCLPLTEAAQALAYSLFLAGLLTIGSIYMPPITGIGLVCLCPLLSFFHWQKCNAVAPLGILELPIADFLTTRLIVLVALLYIAGGSIFSTMTIEQDYPYLFYLSNGAYVAGCLMAVGLLKKSSVPDLHSIFFPVLPLIGMGFLLFPLLRPGYNWIAFTILQCGVAFLDMYTWLLFSSLSRLHKQPLAVCSFGLGLITFFICGGNALSFILSSYIEDISRLNLICLIAGMACLLAIHFFYTTAGVHQKQELPQQEEVSSLVPPSPDTAATENPEPVHPIITVEEIHDRYRIGGLSIYLTPREKQVLFLLARGYGYKAISEKLIITNNTVKFHVRNIYTKFSVTNRHDLLEKLASNEESSL